MTYDSLSKSIFFNIGYNCKNKKTNKKLFVVLSSCTPGGSTPDPECDPDLEADVVKPDKCGKITDATGPFRWENSNWLLALLKCVSAIFFLLSYRREFFF